MGKEKKEKKTIVLAGRTIPLTDSGLPNKVYLSKAEREVVKSYEEKMRQEKKEIFIKELTDILKDLPK
jgi:alpha-N-acetylglucosamine transferase